MSVTLAQASTIVDVALRRREMNLVPMTVAVLDAGGPGIQARGQVRHVRCDIAYGKA
jgi:uncharacterized protein GlcG (DUF336 family)